MTSAAQLAALVPPPFRAVIQRLEGAGHHAVVVGGAVRDLLMGRPPGDFDVASSALPEQVMALFPDVVPTGLQHGTVSVLVDAGGPHRVPVEVTTFRVEGGYADGRRPDHVAFVKDIAEDLSRRDFTVNAVALRLFPEPVLEDPFHGREDLEHRVLRAVGSADLRFGEDGLRAVRAARFAAVLELQPVAGLEDAMARAAPVVLKVAPERVLQELVKLFDKARQPARGLRMLARTDLLSRLLPDAPADEASLSRTDRVTGPPAARWAAWLWDAGKPRALATLGALRSSRALQEDVAALVSVPRPAVLEPAPDAVLRQVARAAGRARWDALWPLWRAENGDALIQRTRSVLAQGFLDSPAQLALDGHALAAATGARGAALGKLLKELLARVDQDPALNQATALERTARELAGR